MPSHLRAIAILLPVALAAAGCGSFGDGYVAKNWQNNMRELGVYPIFPPREDFFVGDVYLSAPGFGCQTGFLQIGQHIGYVNLSNEIVAHQKLRPDLPITGTGQSAYLNWAFGTTQTGAPPPVTQPSSSSGALTLPTSVNRLRLVAFPDFASASYKGGNLSALIPTEIPILAGLGITGENIETVVFRVPLAESIGLPAPVAFNEVAKTDAIKSIFKDETSLQRYLPSEPCDPALSRQRTAARAENSKAVVTVVSEVYYARALDISISLKSKFGADIKAALSDANASAVLQKLIDANRSALAASPPAAVVPAGPNGSIADIAAEARAQAARNSAVSTPGVSVGIVRADSGGITMRRTFERPIAIGFRGVFVDIKNYGTNSLDTATRATVPPTNYTTLEERLFR